MDGFPFYTNFSIIKAQELQRTGGRNNLRTGRWEESCTMLTSRQGMSITHTNSQQLGSLSQDLHKIKPVKVPHQWGRGNRLHPNWRNRAVDDLLRERESLSLEDVVLVDGHPPMWIWATRIGLRVTNKIMRKEDVQPRGR